MAFNIEAAQRIDYGLGVFAPTIAEKISRKKMFGGLSSLCEGSMATGLLKDDLAVRGVPGKIDAVLKLQHVRPMDFTKRPMIEFIHVAPEGYRPVEHLHYFLELGLEHVMQGLSVKKPSKP